MAATDDCLSSARLLASKDWSYLKIEDGLKQLNLESMKEEVINVLRLFLEVDNETLQETARTSAFKLHDTVMALMACRDKNRSSPLKPYMDKCLPGLHERAASMHPQDPIVSYKQSASDLGGRVAVKLKFRTLNGKKGKLLEMVQN